MKNGFCQINLADSSISVIGYWDKNEKQTYSISQENYKLKGADTTSREVLKYDVDIVIRDSTAKSYTIDWHYKNFQSSTDNKFTAKLLSITDKLDVIIKTDEMGTFLEVVNWKEIRDYINKALDILAHDFSDIPKIKEICEQVAATFTSREAIESAAIKDILQLYNFHGGKYRLNEQVQGKVKLANIFGGEPFDADVEMELTTLDTANNSAVIRYVQDVNKEQAADATFEYLKRTSKASGLPEPKREDIPELSIEDKVVSSIHGPSGWVLYSISIREVTADDVTTIETREIELN